MEADEFLTILFKMIRDQIKEQGQQHPEDIMCAVTMITDTVYQFVAACPTGYFRYPGK